MPEGEQQLNHGGPESSIKGRKYVVRDLDIKKRKIEETCGHSTDRAQGRNHNSNKVKKGETMSVLRTLRSPEVMSAQFSPSMLIKYDLEYVKGGNGRELSPGALTSKRVAVQAQVLQSSSDASGEERLSDSCRGDASEVEDHKVYFASGRSVFVVDLIEQGSQQGKSLFNLREGNRQVFEKGKGGVSLPSYSRDKVVSREILELKMRTEVQSLCMSAPNSHGESCMACTDSTGRALLVRLQSNGVDTNCSSLEMIDPRDGGQPCELGWTGAAVSPWSMGIVAIARHFPRDVTVFDHNVPIRECNTLYPPNDLLLMSPDMSTDGDRTPILAVAEGPDVCIWDLRVAGRGGRIARLMPGAFSGQLYTIAASSRYSGCPVLGAAGEDRTVHVWDPRTWKSVDKWSNCLKYEVTSLHFMSNPAFCVVGGLDYEVVCSRWMGGSDQSDKGFGAQKLSKGRAAGPATAVGSEAEAGRQSNVAASFRGAARWLGLAKSPSSDTFAGITADKTLYCTSFTSI
eukprot:jgi/Picsp_1/3194/NSC_06034-R1_hypothetical protein CHLNCDRAFT_143873 [Chlorella variabilis]